MGYIFIIVTIVTIVIIVYSSRKRKKEEEKRFQREIELKRREDEIYQKYGQEIEKKILEKTVWKGETTEQLTDSLGKPIDIDEYVLKTKKKEVWKYYPKSTNRYGLKMLIEDGVVVGWDEKL